MTTTPVSSSNQFVLVTFVEPDRADTLDSVARNLNRLEALVSMAAWADAMAKIRFQREASAGGAVMGYQTGIGYPTPPPILTNADLRNYTERRVSVAQLRLGSPLRVLLEDPRMQVEAAITGTISVASGLILLWNRFVNAKNKTSQADLEIMARSVLMQDMTPEIAARVLAIDLQLPEKDQVEPATDALEIIESIELVDPSGDPDD